MQSARAAAPNQTLTRFDPAWLGMGLAALLVAPIVALLALAWSGDAEYLAHIASTRLAEFSLNSAMLAIASGLGAAVVGIGTALLVTRYDFPGRRLFDVALLLPLAMPGYIAAYSWYHLTAPGGAVHGSAAGIVPTISGISGAAFVFALTLYPYVYLLVRNALEMNGPVHREMARSLGARPHQLFWRIDLPTIWPAAAAGVALVAMEVLADYGVADFLGVPTFTVGIVRAWSSFGEPASAAQLAVMLLFVSLVALGAERASRGRRRFGTGGAGRRPSAREPLTHGRAWLAVLVCSLPLLLGLLVPLLDLLLLALETRPARPVLPAVGGTAGLAAASGALAVVVGLSAAYALRTGRKAGRVAVRIAQAGYAVPGAVAAIAVLAFLVFVQAMIDWLPGEATLVLTGGSLLALLFAYQVRFAAVAILPCENALAKIAPSQDEMARSLGARPWGVVRRIHLPLAKAGIGAAALLVGVEVIKELPATMILRPFDLETLAVTAHNYASDERLAQAALPSLILLLVSIPATAALNLLRVR